jgi:iron complex transport system substrate-binding protein
VRSPGSDHFDGVWFDLRKTLTLLATLVLIGCAGRERTAIHDDLGRPVALRAAPCRIVSLAPNLTAMLFAIGAGARIVATDDYSDEPREAKMLPKVGGVQPSVERIVAEQPDLVLSLSGSNHPTLASALSGAGVPLYVVRTDRLDDVARVMDRLSDDLSAPAGHAAAARLREHLAAQQRVRSRHARVLFVIWTNPLYVAGRDTFADDLFKLTGAVNAVTSSGWPQYSVEQLAAAPPDLLLFPSISLKREQLDDLVRSAPSLAKARIIPVDENLFTRPGPRVAEAAAGLNAILDAWERTR